MFIFSKKILKHSLSQKILIGILLSLGIFIIYKAVYPNPRTWYDHFLYLAQSFTQGRVDVANLPDWYQDAVNINGHRLLPFPPVPAVVIIPFLSLNSAISQQQISVILGAVNIFLIFWLLAKVKNYKIATIVAVFYGLGTVAFWSSIVGTSWYLAHTCSVLFLTLSLICHFYKKNYLAGLFYAAAVLCRFPVALAGVFFFLELYKDRSRLIKFTLGALPLIPIYFLYNWVRFNSLFELGYLDLYHMYVDQGYAYSFIRIIKPDWPAFGYLDPRNVPLHLVSFLALPPTISKDFAIQPSAYGMGLIFTSPFLLISLIPNFKDKLQKNLWLGALAVASVDFLHYAQGWVQFGYRFALDFMPFLILILALKFKISKLFIVLLIISILVNFWGVGWAITLGW